jgi:hypothetical protein
MYEENTVSLNEHLLHRVSLLTCPWEPELSLDVLANAGNKTITLKDKMKEKHV